MEQLTRDEVIRMKAAELSIGFCGQVTGGMLANPNTRKITALAPFHLCEDIELYIRKGIIPEPIIPETE
jgi:hypothetical protein